MQITTRTNNGYPIIDLNGRLYLGPATKELRETFHKVAETHPEKIIINMQNVTHLDTPGLGELIECHSHAKNRGKKLVLLNPQEKLIHMLIMTRLRTVFDIFQNETQAVGSPQSNTVKT